MLINKLWKNIVVVKGEAEWVFYPAAASRVTRPGEGSHIHETISTTLNNPKVGEYQVSSKDGNNHIATTDSLPIATRDKNIQVFFHWIEVAFRIAEFGLKVHKMASKVRYMIMKIPVEAPYGEFLFTYN